ncbi:MAG: nicotinate-nucleotide--dimethylbenzimidazole phosphoribosyltransferase [Candidatus Humimicrobiaceae bacterium]
MYTIDQVRESIGQPDEELTKKAQEKLDNLTKPKASLGRLEEIAKKIVSITGNLKPSLDRKYIATMAADHGIVTEGVSAYPKEVTTQMVLNFLNNGAAINVLCKHIGAEVIVVDVGVDHDFKGHPRLFSEKIMRGTNNFLKGPAMSEEQALQSINAGIRTTEKLLSMGCDIIGTGDMGIGNTTASSAIASVICKIPVKKVTGRGTGIGQKEMENKIKVIEEAIKVNRPDRKNCIDILAKVGGLEIGGIAGLILGCAMNKVPVVIDGFISGAGALIAEGIEPKSAKYMLASHCSVEVGHKIILEKLGLRQMLDFNMRLGEGTGAALGINIAEASIKILNEMANFDSAGVSKKND